MTLSQYCKSIVSGATALNNAQRTTNFINAVMIATDNKAIVTSTVRTAEHNKAVGGVPTSKHLNTIALAVDFHLNQALLPAINKIADEQGFWILIHDAGSGNHIHAEYSPKKKTVSKSKPITQTVTTKKKR